MVRRSWTSWLPRRPEILLELYREHFHSQQRLWVVFGLILLLGIGFIIAQWSLGSQTHRVAEQELLRTLHRFDSDERLPYSFQDVGIFWSVNHYLQESCQYAESEEPELNAVKDCIDLVLPQEEDGARGWPCFMEGTPLQRALDGVRFGGELDTLAGFESGRVEPSVLEELPYSTFTKYEANDRSVLALERDLAGESSPPDEVAEDPDFATHRRADIEEIVHRLLYWDVDLIGAIEPRDAACKRLGKSKLLRAYVVHQDHSVVFLPMPTSQPEPGHGKPHEDRDEALLRWGAKSPHFIDDARYFYYFNGYESAGRTHRFYYDGLYLDAAGAGLTGTVVVPYRWLDAVPDGEEGGPADEGDGVVESILCVDFLFEPDPAVFGAHDDMATLAFFDRSDIQTAHVDVRGPITGWSDLRVALEGQETSASKLIGLVEDCESNGESEAEGDYVAEEDVAVALDDDSADDGEGAEAEEDADATIEGQLPESALYCLLDETRRAVGSGEEPESGAYLFAFALSPELWVVKWFAFGNQKRPRNFAILIGTSLVLFVFGLVLAVPPLATRAMTAEGGHLSVLIRHSTLSAWAGATKFLASETLSDIRRRADPDAGKVDEDRESPLESDRRTVQRIELISRLADELKSRLIALADILNNWDGQVTTKPHKARVVPFGRDHFVQILRTQCAVYSLISMDREIREQLGRKWRACVVSTPRRAEEVFVVNDGLDIFDPDAVEQIEWPEATAAVRPLPEAFDYVLGELLCNAVRWGKKGSRPRVRFAATSSGLQVIVKNMPKDAPGSEDPYSGRRVCLHIGRVFGLEVHIDRPGHPSGLDGSFTASVTLPLHNLERDGHKEETNE